MRIKYNGTINASSDKDYASLKGTDFDKAKAVLTKDGYKEHEYGDKDDNNGYAVYRKGDKEVELTYEWIKGKRNGEAHAGKVLDVYVDDNINGACGGKKSDVKSSVKRSRRAVKAAFRDNTIDTDAVRELVLNITNDGDQYAKQITPMIENLKRKYKKGNYDRDMAVKLWQYAADEGVRRYDKLFGNGGGSVAWLNPATRRAIAEELRDYYEEEIMYEPPVESSVKSIRKKPVKASRRAVMAGPGAGYTIKWNLESINSINSFNVTNVSEPDQYGLITAEADCDVDVTVEIVEAYSYYYGIDSPINGVPAKMTKVTFEIDPGLWPEISSLYDVDVTFAEELLNNEIYDVVNNGEVMYGGGWTHSTWDGTLTDYGHDDLIEVKVTDEEVIQYVDDAVSGAFESDYDDTEDFDLEEY